MIIGTLKNDEIQIVNQKNRYFDEALKIIKKNDFSMIDDGKYYLEHNKFFYIVSTYKTKNHEEASYNEAHIKYIDFHYLIYGEELIGYASYDYVKRYQSDYDGEKDLELFNCVNNESFFLLKKDMFAIFYPYEIHRSGISYFERRSVRKVIFKISVKE